MINLKRVIGLIVVMAMLFSFASFAALAETSTNSTTRPAKEITLVANATNSAFTLPEGEVLLVGDTIVIPLTHYLTVNVGERALSGGNWNIKGTNWADIVHTNGSSGTADQIAALRLGKYTITEEGTYRGYIQHWGLPSFEGGSGRILDDITTSGYASDYNTSSDSTSSDITSSEETSSDVTSSDVTSSDATSSEETSSVTTPTIVEETFKTPKKVNLQLKKTLAGIGNYFSGHFAAPDETIYVGDTIVISHDTYSELFSDGIDSISVGLQRIGDSAGDTGATSWLYGVEDASWTLGLPGKYQVVISDFRKNTAQVQTYVHGSYNCVIEVLPTPVSIPEKVQAPTYIGKAGTVSALVQSTSETITDETKAFMMHYNRDLGYADFEKPINTKLDHGTFPGLLEYYQFNLDKMAFVDNVVIKGTTVSYADILASVDGEHWYKLYLNQKIQNNTVKVGSIAKYIRVKVKSFDSWGACTVSSYTINGYAVNEADVIVPEYDDSHIATDNVGVAPKEIQLVVNETGTRFKVPDGIAVNVGDTLVFDTDTFLDVAGTQRALSGGAWWFFVTIPSGTRYDPFNEPDRSYLISSKNPDFSNGRFLVQDIGTYTAYTQFWGKPVWGSFGGGWCETFSVSDVAGDPEEVKKYSNEIISYPPQEYFIGDKSTRFTLSFDVKMIQNEKPMFTYYSDANGQNEISPSSETITLNYSDETGYYYTVNAVFNVKGEETTVYVRYGLNYRFELGVPVPYTRTLSNELFSGDNFIGENRFTSTSYQVKPTDTVVLSLTLQDVIDNTIVIGGVEYNNVRVVLGNIVSLGERFDYVDKETEFIYNNETKVWEAIITAKKNGIDQFEATVELVGNNSETGEDEVIDTRTVTTDYITVETPVPAIDWNTYIGGNPEAEPADGEEFNKFQKLLLELREDYKNKDYVIVDMTDKNSNAYMNSFSWQRLVSAELWNALKDMNKSKIIFRGSHISEGTGIELDSNGKAVAVDETLIYEIIIDKKDHTMLDQATGKAFRVGFTIGYPNDKVTNQATEIENSVKEQLGYGYQPFGFFAQWGMGTEPFVHATLNVEIPTRWMFVNGTTDLAVYKIARLDAGGASVTEKFNGITLDYDYIDKEKPLKKHLSLELDTADLYAQYVLIGEDGTVDRTNNADKNNVATGGLDLSAVIAVFSAIALGTLVIKKHK